MQCHLLAGKTKELEKSPGVSKTCVGRENIVVREGVIDSIAVCLARSRPLRACLPETHTHTHTYTHTYTMEIGME